MNKASDIFQRYERVISKYAMRDTRNRQVKLIREGRVHDVAPSLFPDDGPWQEPIVANMIDVAARDLAEKVAPLPTLLCESTGMSESGRRKALAKTKIAVGYVTHSNLQLQMYNGADKYVTYGSLPMRVEVDWEERMPFIRLLDPLNSYPEIDRFGRVQALFQRQLIPVHEILTLYPETSSALRMYQPGAMVDVIYYHDKHEDVIMFNTGEPTVLERVANPIGKCMVRVAQRPGATDIPRGQFDDVIFVQLAKAQFALLAMQAADDSVNAPIVVPSDVTEFPVGNGALIRTNNPGGVARVPLQVPSEAFAEQSQLDRELNLGSRFPEVRTGNLDASIVTGKGVNALMDGYDSQIKAHQAVFADSLQQIVSLAFEVDEKVFGSETKKLRGSNNGTPYEITYTPSKDIGGDYTVDVAYGLMAGLDPNRALVFGLQARADKLISREFLRKEMPFDMDVDSEALKVDLEDLEDAARQALQGYASSIPQLASSGIDPAPVVAALSKVISLRKKGKTMAEALAEVWPEPPPAPTPPAPDPAAEGMSPEDAALAAMGMGAPGEASMLPPESQNVPGAPPSGRPDLQTMLAGLDAKGNPNMSSGVMRSRVI